MLKNRFDPALVYLVVVYLRMSSKNQNERSPDQQLAEIKRRLDRLGYPWKIVKIYRDDAKSGRRKSNRPQFQAMLLDIHMKNVKVDLILVDTIERFGRFDDLPAVRRRLHEEDGVRVLTADTDFADPLTEQGQSHALLEENRAVKDSRTKAHNVSRGRLDVVLQKRWPGGPTPFGLKVNRANVERVGHRDLTYSTLVPDPESAWIVQLSFQQAHATGWGQDRLTKWLNHHNEIPDKFRRFQGPTVGYMLDNTVYMGTYTFGRVTTGIANDRRVREVNPDNEVYRVENFCEALVPVELWDAVQLVRNTRRQKIELSRNKATDESEKLITPVAAGMTLKYLLSGLVRCGHCRRAMTASSNHYQKKNGDISHYVAYSCPGAAAGDCPNSKRFDESWLRAEVGRVIRQRLFALAT